MFGKHRHLHPEIDPKQLEIILGPTESKTVGMTAEEMQMTAPRQN